MRKCRSTWIRAAETPSVKQTHTEAMSPFHNRVQPGWSKPRGVLLGSCRCLPTGLCQRRSRPAARRRLGRVSHRPVGSWFLRVKAAAASQACEGPQHRPDSPHSLFSSSSDGFPARPGPCRHSPAHIRAFASAVPCLECSCRTDVPVSARLSWLCRSRGASLRPLPIALILLLTPEHKRSQQQPCHTPRCVLAPAFTAHHRVLPAEGNLPGNSQLAPFG